MKSNKRYSISFLFLILFFGIISGSILSQIIGGILPAGVVKDFFLNSISIGWGLRSDNWIDLYIIRFKTGFFMDVSVVSILGLAISWYYLRYFK